MRTLLIEDDEYPPLLRDNPNPPAVLWVEGAALEHRRAIAIVGPRDPSPRARDFAEELAEEVARRGTIVVSGGAKGIDSAAHRGACRSGATWVILPCGLEKAAVKEGGVDPTLYERIRDAGALISTFEPHVVATVPNHHIRNTTISRLVTDMVVIAAGQNSGSQSVGRKALAAHIRVFTFRGPCYDPSYAGTARLLAHGAVEPPSVDALIAALTAKPRRALKADEKLVLAALRMTPRHVDEVMENVPLPSGRVSSALLTLALDNVVVEGPSGHFRRNST